MNALDTLKTVHKANSFKNTVAKRAKAAEESLLGSKKKSSSSNMDSESRKRTSSGGRRTKSSGSNEGPPRSASTKAVPKPNPKPKDAESIESEGSKRNWKPIIYVFVARDSEMIVFETHAEKQVQQEKFQADIFEILNTYQDIDDLESRPAHQQKSLGVDGLVLEMHYDTIFYGIVAASDFGSEKAQRLLNDVKQEVKGMYKGNVSFMLKQSNLERNCLDKFLRSKILRIIDNYSSKIERKNLNQAFQKVDEIKDIAGRTIGKMAENMDASQKLLEKSNNIKFDAKDFQKNSATLETMMRNQSFWMCSRPCLIIFGVIFGFIFLIWFFSGGDEE